MSGNSRYLNKLDKIPLNTTARASLAGKDQKSTIVITKTMRTNDKIMPVESGVFLLLSVYM